MNDIQNFPSMPQGGIAHFLEIQNTDLWIWIAFILIVFILVLLFFLKKNTQKDKMRRFKEETMKQYVDFGNIINSSFHASKIYDELKVKCHPDRITNDSEKNKIVNALFQEITQNKYNMKKLLELKERAKQELDIHF